MTEYRKLPAEQVKKAADSLRAALPAYQTLLSFYEQLFIAQENLQLQLSLDPIVIAPEVLQRKRSEQLPLVAVTEFVFDAAAGRQLLSQICEIIRTSGSEMASAAKRIDAAVGSKLEIEALFRHLLAGDDDWFADTADHIGCDKNSLAFIAYNSLKPALAVCAQQLATYLTDQSEESCGTCPVCANLPAVAIIDPEGRRWMSCSFCWHQWPVPRVGCPFCDSTDTKKLHYLYSQTEKALRVNCCENCRKYIKVVDERAAGRAIYPPLEQIASLHLDIKAREAGFESGIPLHLPDD